MHSKCGTTSTSSFIANHLYAVSETGRILYSQSILETCPYFLLSIPPCLHLYKFCLTVSIHMYMYSASFFVDFIIPPIPTARTERQIILM